MGKAIRILLVILGSGVLVLGGVERGQAQTHDPVGLISSAAIVPFWAAPPLITVLETTSPIGDNDQMHMFFFNAQCARVFSRPFSMSTHDADVISTLDLGATFNGIVALARSSNNITIQPLQNPVTFRAHRVDLVNDALWRVDPISAANPEAPGNSTWSPMRSAAVSISFPQGNQTATRWWFVCLGNNVPMDVGAGIPILPPSAKELRFRVFDLDETPLLDAQTECSCLTEVNPASLHPLFSTEELYVEIFATVNPEPNKNALSFVQYRHLRFVLPGGQNLDEFGRVSQMSAPSLLLGVPQVGAR